MNSKVNERDLQDRLPEFLDRVVNKGEPCFVQRNGKDCAVIVSARQWRQREVGRQIDALGPDFRLSRNKQVRMEQLLAASQQRTLTGLEQRALKTLLRECDAILRKRTAVLERSR